MATFTPLLAELIESLRCLPGVGQKTAQRMAFALMDGDRDDARKLSEALRACADGIRLCERCRLFSDAPLCPVCTDPARDDTLLCVVESAADVYALEQATGFRGRYFVLLGHLSPLDGIGPGELGLDLLSQQMQSQSLREIIIATNPTVEGDATAHYISDMAARYSINTSRIAHGVPVGGELEYVDGGTLSHAFNGRRQMNWVTELSNEKSS
ncbi:MAG: recombination mediator RecR [Pseudomonadota bacterium]